MHDMRIAPIAIARMLAALLACFSLCGCGTKPTLVEAQLAAAGDVNPDAKGRASPIVVRLYELKSVAAFDGADFFSLWDKDQATLGGDMAARDEYLMRPGEQRKIERSTQNGTAFIGVVAAFRDIERARWRASFAVPPNKTTELTIKLENHGIALTEKKD